MWGTGARDDFTIASLFAKELSKNNVGAKVVNYGESGYVSTQELILLIQELQSGNIPKLVIFYDGVNDVYSALQQGKAGIPQNEFNRVAEFQTSFYIKSEAIEKVFNEMSILRIIRGVSARFGLSLPLISFSRGEIKDIQRRPSRLLAKDVLDIYENNILIAHSLSQKFGFKALFYWQPTIYNKKRLTGYEERERLRMESEQSFFEVTNEVLKQDQDKILRMSEHGFHDISNIYENISDAIFIDFCHTAEYGNTLIARRMLKDALPFLSSNGVAINNVFSSDGAMAVALID